MVTFCCGSYNLEVSVRTHIMGILNVTPDSFSDGGRYIEPDAAVSHALEMVRDGADIIDIGAQSTRPGHISVTAEQEWERLKPVLLALKGVIEIPISVDTYYPDVAKESVEAGASIINDVLGSMENGMAKIAAETGAGLIMMHAGGGSDDTGDGVDTIKAVSEYFKCAIDATKRAALPLERLCLDPGIGFGKDRQGDLKLISRLPELFHELPETAILIGASRKRVIASCCDKNTPPADERLAGTLAINTIAAWNGAHILRVHDVAEAVQAARVTDALYASLK